MGGLNGDYLGRLYFNLCRVPVFFHPSLSGAVLSWTGSTSLWLAVSVPMLFVSGSGLSPVCSATGIGMEGDKL